MSIHRRGKSNSIKDLLVKIARREHIEISEGNTTLFAIYASAWLERRKGTLARSTYGDYRSIWRKYVFPHFGNVPLCRVTRLNVEEFLASIPDISAKRKHNIMVPRCWASVILCPSTTIREVIGDCVRTSQDCSFDTVLSPPDRRAWERLGGRFCRPVRRRIK